MVGGRLGDIYGRKRMFVVGAVGFTAASVLCSVAAGPEMLTAARFLQGGLGALMIPQGLGLIKQMFPPKETAAAFGAFGPAIGLGAVLGPIVAGFLVDADLFGTGWRSVFLINLPIGVAVIVGAVLLLPEGKAPVRPKFDVVGMALVTSGLTLLIFPLVQGRERGWPAWAFVLMLAGAAVLVASSPTNCGRRGAAAPRSSSSACCAGPATPRDWRWHWCSSPASPECRCCSPCTCRSAWASAPPGPR